MTSININLFNMLFTKRPFFIADLARSLPAIPLLIDVRKMAGRTGLLFAFLLLHKRIASLTRRTSTRRSATFMKGTEYGTVSRYCKSARLCGDSGRRRSGLLAGMEEPTPQMKLIWTSMPVIVRNDSIKHKLPNRMSIVKIKICRELKNVS